MKSTAPSSLRRRTCAGVLVSSVLLALVVPAAPASATWIDGGVPLSTAPGTQQLPAIISDGAGGAIIVWVDVRTGGHDIYARRVAADGTPLWADNGVPVCTALGSQKEPVIASDGQGGAIIAWKDERSGEYDLYAQRLDAGGNPLWGSDGTPVCVEAGEQIDPEIVADGQGGAIIVWRDWRSTVPKLYAQKLAPNGGKLWTSTGVLVCNVVNQWNASLVSDGQGGAIAVWFDYRNGVDFSIFAQRITATGSLAWSGGGVAVCTASGNQLYPRATSDGQGGIYAVWYDYRSASGYDIYAQRLTGGGAIYPGWPTNGVAVCTAPFDQAEPVIVADGSGGAIVSWYDNRSVVAVYAQHLTGGGAVYPGWTANGIKLCQSPSTRPTIVTDDGGGALVAWHGTPGQTNLDISVQHITGAGQIPADWPSDGLYLCTAPNDQQRPVAVSTGSGDAIVAWSDMRTDGGDIYAARVSIASTNLNVTLTPGAFSAPVVPRNRADAALDAAVLTPVLDGNQATTSLNWAIDAEGPGTVPAWNARISIDGAEVATVNVPAGEAPGFHQTLNHGPMMVRGGRHTITIEADPGQTLDEVNERDNRWSGQFVWSPLVMSRSVPAMRPAPPAAGDNPQPNADGMSFSPAPGMAWVTALAPTSPADDYSLWLYDDYSGSTSGFTHTLAVSEAAGGATRFVVGRSAAGTVYPAAVRRNAGGPGEDFLVDQTDATGRIGSSSDARWAAQSLDALRLADVYEGDFVAGQTYYINLVKVWGEGDLKFDVFPCAAGGTYTHADAIASSGNLTPDGTDVDVVSFTAPATGRYPLVVYRTDAIGTSLRLTYHFFWSSTVSGVDEERPRPPSMVLLGASPNPMPGHGRIAFVLPGAGHVSLVVYDVAGRAVRHLVDGHLDAGEQDVYWDGRGDDGGRLGSGVYYARLVGSGESRTRSITLVH